MANGWTSLHVCSYCINDRSFLREYKNGRNLLRMNGLTLTPSFLPIISPGARNSTVANYKESSSSGGEGFAVGRRKKMWLKSFKSFNVTVNVQSHVGTALNKMKRAIIHCQR